ncbi:MAG: hypothetical protein WC340_16290 [Kiritimatiellia bacterium]
MTKTCPECGAEFETNRNARVYCGRRCSNAVTARNRENGKLDGPVTTVWSCGGGVQSTAIAALIVSGKLSKPDYAMMTDCGYEQQATMQYVRRVLIPELQAVGVTLHILDTLNWSNNDIIDSTGHITIPAYKRMPDGKCAKLRTHCNEAWKVKPLKRWIRSLGIERCENWIGISTDEARRQRPSAKRWLTHRYPLIEMGMSREDCLWSVCSLGWPKPAHSSCVFCPQRDSAGWATMKREAPEDWQRAIAMDEALRKHDPDVYLHRSMTPLAGVSFKGEG